MLLKPVHPLSLLCGVILLPFGLIPLFCGFRHAGNWLLTLWAAWLILMGLAKSSGRMGRILRIGWRLTQLAALLFLTGLAAIFWFGWMQPPDPGPHTIVVLGCQTVNGRPSVMLKHRLETAWAYWQEHPKSPILLSGGQDPGEPKSEAQVMAEYLSEKGVPAEQLYLEGKSRDTQENLAFSARLIRQRQLPESVVLVSDGFHLCRAGLYARRQQLSPASLPAPSPWGLLPGYLFRELFAIVEALIFPNTPVETAILFQSPL